MIRSTRFLRKCLLPLLPFGFSIQFPVRAFLCVLALILTAPWGCVERELFIKSNPPGAKVCINGRNAGETPVSVSFNYYGCRNIELRCEGYQVQHRNIELSPPWYQYTPLDFFFDLFWPWTLKDVQAFTFELEPYTQENIQNREAILERAKKQKLKHLPRSNQG